MESKIQECEDISGQRHSSIGYWLDFTMNALRIDLVNHIEESSEEDHENINLKKPILKYGQIFMTSKFDLGHRRMLHERITFNQSVNFSKSKLQIDIDIFDFSGM